MHELSIAENIIAIVDESLSSCGGGKLRIIRIKVGELAGVVPDSLEFCFSALTKGTPMEQAKLEIERTAVVARCEVCGVDFAVDKFVFRCPHCNSPASEIVSGNELRVVSVEVED